MKKILIMMFAGMMLIGCNKDSSNYASMGSRFVKISTESPYGYVVYDKQTKVEYWVTASYKILTRLDDAEGNPLIYDEMKGIE